MYCASAEQSSFKLDFLLNYKENVPLFHAQPNLTIKLKVKYYFTECPVLIINSSNFLHLKTKLNVLQLLSRALIKQL